MGMDAAQIITNSAVMNISTAIKLAHVIMDSVLVDVHYMALRHSRVRQKQTVE